MAPRQVVRTPSSALSPLIVPIPLRPRFLRPHSCISKISFRKVQAGQERQGYESHQAFVASVAMNPVGGVDPGLEPHGAATIDSPRSASSQRPTHASGHRATTSSRGARWRRAGTACGPCRRRKTKCDNARPCANCVYNSEACTYTNDVKTPAANVRYYVPKRSCSVSA